jgi:hypothetical protein
MDIFETKYLKYKNKYLQLKKQYKTEKNHNYHGKRPEKNIKEYKNMKGGGLSKNETLELINKLYVCSIENISIEYSGIDEINYRFIEVPQGHIYKYDGNHVIDLGTNQIIASGDNIILCIMGLLTCRGLIIYETDRIIMGHLDSIRSSSPLTLQTIDKSLSGDKEKINYIYYIMGAVNSNCILKEECTLCDISTEVLEIVHHKELEEYVCIVNDFTYTYSAKFGYNWKMDEFITFPIHPAITNRFMTYEDVEFMTYEDVKDKEEFEEMEACANIKNTLIRNKKNSKKYQNKKSKCMSCNFKIKSRGKGKFICSESE